MTDDSRPIERFLTPALLVTSAALAAWNWYLEPARSLAFGSALLLTLVMALALAIRWPGRAGAGAADSIRNGVVFGSSMLSLSLFGKLLVASGAVGGDFTKRGSMALLGLFLASMGNALPKTLVPTTEQCNGSTRQRLMRFSGWTWALSGLGYAVAWLVLPLEIAGTVAMLVLMSGMALVITQLVRVFMRRKSA